MSEFTDLVTSQRPRKLDRAPGGKSGALLATYDGGIRAIVKAAKEKLPSGHSRQRGIPAEVHPLHEVAFYQLARLFGCAHLVPETVLTTKAVPGVIASAQLFVPAHHLNELQPKLKDVDDQQWGDYLVEACVVVPKSFWKDLLVLDIVGGVRDRHANNVGIIVRSQGDRPLYRPIAWDNAVSFGDTFDRYHNVFHKYLFRRSVDLGAAWRKLDGLTRGELRDAIGEYVGRHAVEHAYLRGRFFSVDFPYRLPWKVCSKGEDSPHEFPTYQGYFERVATGPLHLPRVAA